MDKVSVPLAGREYDIYIGPGALQNFDFARLIAGRDVLIVSSETPAKLYADVLIAQIKRSHKLREQSAAQALRLESIVFADGESAKTLASAGEIFAKLAHMQASRDVTLVALGGGVIGDLTGFAAALWMRGVAFIQVPTTLLAMVDSSVGGKTAVNLPAGKNLVGAFWQPKAVVADIDVLRTLPTRELSAGLAEVLKYGAYGDAEFFAWLEAHAAKLLQLDPVALTHAIVRSCQQKAGVVLRDERETGERMLLNFGHTFGHAIEALMDYKGILHGEAVAIGMVRAAQLSADIGLSSAADTQRLIALSHALQLPTRVPPALLPAALLATMRLDKKAISGAIRLILWRGIGAGFVGTAEDAAILRAWTQ
jgi:3-dehydroquinate synthase